MRFQHLDDWLDWQSRPHPAEIELGLERVAAVWGRLRPAGLNAQVITIGGTNGKGSTAAMLEGIYLQAGYRVATYTSPHLVRYNERIRINGADATDPAICAAFDRVDRAREGVSLTYFEFGTLAALDIFAAACPDLVILEVGLGGRLDAVNVVDPDIAIITTVGLDHTDWLGESLEQIGLEKAGIMRAGRPVILGEPEMPQSVLDRAAEVGAECLQLGQNFEIIPQDGGFLWKGGGLQYHSVFRPVLPGEFQLQNLACALTAQACLAGLLPVPQWALERAIATSGLRGRIQIIDGEIPLVLDVAHNAQAVAALSETLRDRLPKRRFRAVFGLLADKDLSAILQSIHSMIESWHLLSIDSSRGQAAERLAARLREAGIHRPISCHGDIAEAIGSARSEAGVGEGILVFGSFVVVGAALAMLEKTERLS
jgi:dihydrofolate synthase/folylpolyglutamate synthase